ncbi:MAG: ComEC/Rec2 family competence protein [Actinomycetales bacterium]|nr:ComEC/Rec2 family competence protein [Actinomycetales bacterium]
MPEVNVSRVGQLVDLRLVPVAVSAWITVLVLAQCWSWLTGLAAARVIAVGVLMAGTGLAISALVARLPVLVGIGVGAVAIGVHLVAISAAPVTDWVRAGATASVEAVITADAEQRVMGQGPIWGAAELVELPASTSSVAARGQRVQVALPILVRASAQVSLPPVGSVVRLQGRLHRARDLGHAFVLTLAESSTGPSDAVTLLRRPGPLDAAANAMRAGLQASTQRVDPRAGALVAGLAIGDETGQSTLLADQMRASGLSHLTAVSGGNLAVVIAAVFAFSRVLRMRTGWRVATALAAVTFFVVLVRPEPSVVRAALMGAVVLLGLLPGGRRAGPSVLATAVLVLVLWAPALTATWGFALSVVATGGLILLSEPVEARMATSRVLGRWPLWCRQAMAVTLAAQIATLPLLIAMGAPVGWVAVPANLLAMPAVPLVTILGLLATLVSPVLPVVADVLTFAASWPAAWIAGVAAVGSELPFGQIPWPSGWSGVGLLAAFVAVVWLLRRPLRVWVRYPVVIGAAVLAIALVLTGGRRGWPPPGWAMIACDVGQGDGSLVRVGTDSAVLVDVGPDERSITDCLTDAGISSIPLVVITHFHADHVVGLGAVLDRFPVGQVFVTPVAEPQELAAMAEEWTTRAGVPVRTLRAGEAFSVQQAKFTVIWPARRIDAGSVPNNASIVMVAELPADMPAPDAAEAGLRVLLTGDVEREAQAAILAAVPAPQVDVVKVPHHGSANGDPRFPQWSGARVAIISVGEGNTYGHPRAEAIAAWQQVGATVLRTDQDGSVAVVANPLSIVRGP